MDTSYTIGLCQRQPSLHKNDMQMKGHPSMGLMPAPKRALHAAFTPTQLGKPDNKGIIIGHNCNSLITKRHEGHSHNKHPSKECI